jgi:GT2 family glycosyltransferase
MSVAVDVLIPACGRPAALAVLLAGLLAQTERRFRVVIADQGDAPGADPAHAAGAAELAAAVRVLEARGHQVLLHRRERRRGVAENRDFLLRQARAPRVWFLDDDVIVEPDLLARLMRHMDEERCGFVGCGLIGLSFRDDVRPHEQAVEFWEGRVEPEEVRPGTPAWERHRLHNAANLLHLAQRLAPSPGESRVYRVAWVGGCVLYDRAALEAVGGFGFWRQLPSQSAGEDVLAQLRVMARFGGCAVFPSGAYHQELPTTVPDRHVDAPHALSLHPEAAAARAVA